MRLLDALADAPNVAGQRLRPVRRMLSHARSTTLRIEAAKTLWMLERDEAAEQLLRSLALGGGGSQRLREQQLDAFMAFAAGIARKGPERRVVAELALELLRGLPLDDSGERLSVAIVMETLWQYGEPQDAVALLPWLDHADPGLASDAVEFMDRLDPERARAEARERVRRYARSVGRADYAHAVGPFVQLLVRHDDHVALDDLRAAAVPLRAEAPAAAAAFERQAAACRRSGTRSREALLVRAHDALLDRTYERGLPRTVHLIGPVHSICYPHLQ